MNSRAKAPDFIITTDDNAEAREIQFSDIFNLKNKITSIMLLWDYNSYYVNIEQGYFIINGGKRIQPTVATMMLHKKLEYARRNRMDIQMDGDDTLEESDIRMSYLFGIEGIVDNEHKSILLHISEDGFLWGWRDKR